VAAKGERGPEDHGQGKIGREPAGRGDDGRLRDAQPRAADRLAEALTVLRAPDHVDGRSDQLDAEVVEDACVA
jgi:hypothetical protein